MSQCKAMRFLKQSVVYLYLQSTAENKEHISNIYSTGDIFNKAGQQMGHIFLPNLQNFQKFILSIKMLLTYIQSECQTTLISDEVSRFVGPHMYPNCLQRSSSVFKISSPAGIDIKVTFQKG